MRIFKQIPQVTLSWGTKTSSKIFFLFFLSTSKKFVSQRIKKKEIR